MERIFINNLKPGDRFNKFFTMVDDKYIKSKEEPWAYFALDRRTYEVYGWAPNVMVEVTEKLSAKRK